MKKTTRAKAKHRRKLDRAECEAQLREAAPDYIAEEVRRIEQAQYQDWLLSLEEGCEEHQLDWDSIDAWDDAHRYDRYEDSDWYDGNYWDDYEEYDRDYSSHSAYKGCEHCKCLDALNMIGGRESYLTTAERRFLIRTAMQLRELGHKLRERQGRSRK